MLLATWNDYAKQALALANHDLTIEDAREVALLGLMGEAGELCDMVKKVIGQGHETDEAFRQKFLLELGDLCWYVNHATHYLGTAIHKLATAETLTTFERSVPMMPICNPARSVRAIMRQVVELDKLGAGHPFTSGCKLTRITVEVVRLNRAYGFNMREVLQANLDKLHARYPAGFESQRSIHRQA